MNKTIRLFLAISIAAGTITPTLSNADSWFARSTNFMRSTVTALRGWITENPKTAFVATALVATLSYWWCKKSASSACSAKKNDACRKPQRKLIADDKIINLANSIKAIRQKVNEYNAIITGDVRQFTQNTNTLDAAIQQTNAELDNLTQAIEPYSMDVRISSLKQEAAALKNELTDAQKKLIERRCTINQLRRESSPYNAINHNRVAHILLDLGNNQPDLLNSRDNRVQNNPVARHTPNNVRAESTVQSACPNVIEQSSLKKINVYKKIRKNGTKRWVLVRTEYVEKK